MGAQPFRIGQPDNVSFAKLNQGNFRNASLYGTVLTQATLQNVDFDSADLKYANFFKAALKNTNFSNAQMDWAIMPDGNTYQGVVPY